MKIARVSQNGASLFLILGLAVGAVGAGDDLASLQASFLRGEYARVVARTQELLSRSNPEDQDGLLYLQGVSALKLGDLELARATLEHLIGQYPDSEWAAQASLALGDTLMAMGELEKAKGVYQRLLADERAKPLAPRISSRLAEDFFFSVQVGAFRTKANALRLKAELEHRGYETAVGEAQMGGRQFFRVRVGRYLKREEAEQALKRLEGQGFPGKVVP